MVGRAAVQKGVEFFIDVGKRLSPDRFRFVWIGGGDERGLRTLRSAGIEATGWIARDHVLRLFVNEVDVYLHTAVWEGTPITLLEAATLDLPIICRDIPHLDDVPAPLKVRTAEEAAAAVEASADPTTRARLSAGNAGILECFSPTRTRAALLAAYRDCRCAAIARDLHGAIPNVAEDGRSTEARHCPNSAGTPSRAA